jgi:large subunit ribosomal protein L24
VIRFDKNAAVLDQQERADRHAYLRTGSARTSRQEPHEDHLARAGGAVMAAKIKKGDKVVVLAGKDKGRTGEVFKVLPKEDKALSCAASTWSAHTKQTQTQEGGIITKEAPIHCRTSRSSTKDGKPTRVGFKIQKATARRCVSPSVREK